MSILRGLAGGWNDNLGLDWFYKYRGGPGTSRPNTSTDIANPKYVPMMWDGQIDHAGPIPSDYSGHIIFLNEPDSPSQANVSPEDAIGLLELARAEWPNATFVFGNVMTVDGTGYGEEWVKAALDYCTQENITPPEKWGVHIYLWNDDLTSGAWTEYLKIVDHIGSTTPVWVTECGCPMGELRTAELLFHLIANRSETERMALFPHQLSDDPDEMESYGFPMGYRAVNDSNEIWVTQHIDENEAHYQCPYPAFTAFSTNDRVLVFGFTNEENNGYGFVKEVKQSGCRMLVTHDLVYEGSGDIIRMYQNGWNPEMRPWDSTDNEITPMGTLYRDFLEDNMLHMFDTAKEIWNGDHFYSTSGWEALDLTSYGVPTEAKAVLFRISSVPQREGSQYYFGWGDNSGQIHALLRANVQDENQDEMYICGTEPDTGKVYYEITMKSGYRWRWTYLRLIGYFV